MKFSASLFLCLGLKMQSIQISLPRREIIVSTCTHNIYSLFYELIPPAVRHKYLFNFAKIAKIVWITSFLTIFNTVF